MAGVTLSELTALLGLRSLQRLVQQVINRCPHRRMMATKGKPAHIQSAAEEKFFSKKTAYPIVFGAAAVVLLVGGAQYQWEIQAAADPMRLRELFKNSVHQISQMELASKDQTASKEFAAVLFQFKLFFLESMFLQEVVQRADMLPLIVATMSWPPSWLIQSVNSRLFTNGPMAGQAMTLGVVDEILSGSISATKQYPLALKVEQAKQKALDDDIKDPAAPYLRKAQKAASQSALQRMIVQPASPGPRPLYAPSNYYVVIQNYYGATLRTLLGREDRIKFYSTLPSFESDIELACSDDINPFVAGCFLRCVREYREVWEKVPPALQKQAERKIGLLTDKTFNEMVENSETKRILPFLAFNQEIADPVLAGMITAGWSGLRWVIYGSRIGLFKNKAVSGLKCVAKRTLKGSLAVMLGMSIGNSFWMNQMMDNKGVTVGQRSFIMLVNVFTLLVSPLVLRKNPFILLPYVVSKVSLGQFFKPDTLEMLSTSVITASVVEEHLSVASSVGLLAQAFTALAHEKAQLPLRNLMMLPDTKNVFGLMPCSITLENGDYFFGCKTLSVFFTNMGTGYESHQGVVLLFEGQHGQLCAIVDAHSITKIRTAGASGLATKYLARTGPLTLGLLGAGVQADSHIAAMRAVRDIVKVKVWSKTFSKAAAFAQEASKKHGVPVAAVQTAREAISDCDIVCTVTGSTTPVLDKSWLKAGAHINAVGASSAKARELDTATVAAASVYTDRRESILKESGDFLIPVAEGAITMDHLKGDLADLVTGKVKGRTNDSEITVFKSLGLAIEDLICAKHVYDQVRISNAGTQSNVTSVNLHG